MASEPKRQAKAWLELARISNLPTVWSNVLAGWLLAGGALAADWRLGLVLLAGSLLYTGGMILNDAADLGFDREHRPERPLPSGTINARSAWTVGFAMLAAGGACGVLAGAAGHLVAALAGAILLYDFFHKPWPGSVWIMGACRTLLICMAASAMSGIWNNLALLHGITLGCYIVGLTMVARHESGRDKHARGAAHIAIALLLAPLLLAGSRGILYLALPTPETAAWSRLPVTILFAAVFAAWVVWALRVMRRGGPAIGQAVGLLLAAIPLVDALALAATHPVAAAALAATAPLLRRWQRWVAAT